MNYNAKEIYNTAKSFLAASIALNKKLSETNDISTYIAPIVTNTSFSIELLLKCIYMIEKGQPAPNIHHLDKLYRKLSDESRTIIEMIYDMLVSQSQTTMVLKQKVPEMKIDLDSALKEMSSAFINWRYSYEKKLTGFPTAGPIIDALMGRIKILEPDW
ncbi:hypothetical protein ACVNNN_13550 [Lysinibacillus fusiformis]|uniref:hypothetical protein n=1 Tax=Lysinibacillus sp. PWR01 TaxID=3342384 RepID=UPI00372CF858